MELNNALPSQSDEIKKVLPLRLIFNEVCEKHNLCTAEMMAEDRHLALVLARNEFFYRALIETTKSSVTIASFVKRHHTTVLHGAIKHALIYRLRLPRGGTSSRAKRIMNGRKSVHPPVSCPNCGCIVERGLTP